MSLTRTNDKKWLVAWNPCIDAWLRPSPHNTGPAALAPLLAKSVLK